MSEERLSYIEDQLAKAEHRRDEGFSAEAVAEELVHEVRWFNRALGDERKRYDELAASTKKLVNVLQAASIMSKQQREHAGR